MAVPTDELRAIARGLELDAAAFRENTVYDSEGDPMRLVMNAERMEAGSKAILALLDRLAALEAERTAGEARVVELLRPFADKAALIAEDEDEDYCPDWSPFIPVRAYRNAAATLAKQEPGS